jgi:hypothetical protein
MTASVTATPTSGTAVLTVFRATCSGVPNNTATGYDTTAYPTEPQVTYYFKASASGQTTLKGPVFSTNGAGDAEWDGLIIPAAGSWTIGVYKTSDDSSVATTAVTVS